jgi:hypothetical protein
MFFSDSQVELLIAKLPAESAGFGTHRAGFSGMVYGVVKQKHRDRKAIEFRCIGSCSRC